jgi:hypothetical protein
LRNAAGMTGGKCFYENRDTVGLLKKLRFRNHILGTHVAVANEN